MEKLFEISNLQCSYDKRGYRRIVLDIKHLIIPKGKKVFIVGESGIGKSTILEVLGLMNNTIVSNDESSFVFYDGERPVDLISMWKRNDDSELSDFRRRHFNFIFQSTNLMRNFTAYENISITRMLQGYDCKSSFQKASQVLKDLGLGHIDESRMAQELSGGQRQRLAFARAVIPDFTVLFGDEPTGNLDSDNAVNAMRLLSDKLEGLKGSSAIIVTHDMHLATSFADIVVKIKKVSTGSAKGDEIRSHGMIDQDCEFTVTPDRCHWNNGSRSFSTEEFEKFLKHEENE
ncbi:MAG TPA: ATP-binding cassette domain-containing protein [Candidatus Coprenecus pullistercoris]|nr:ATP-binding cassette domain-containing protein [Candidatus Coprenecus pullistercoris]